MGRDTDHRCGGVDIRAVGLWTKAFSNFEIIKTQNVSMIRFKK
jgi:hypothetical protein